MVNILYLHQECFYKERSVKIVMLLKDGVSIKQLYDSKDKTILENDIAAVERLLVNDFEDLSHTDSDGIFRSIL